MAANEPRPYAPITTRYGSIGQNGEWKEAIEAYYWDRMPEAFAVAQALGAGYGGAALRWYRMIEGEALTREQAEVREQTPWLTIEAVPIDESDDARYLTIQEACEGVARLLEWDFSMGVRATILLPEVDAPWHEARFGYCVDKYPYDKICLPQAAAMDPHSLARVAAHEFTHVVTLNLTGGRIPHWLDEGLAMLMESAGPRPIRHWLEPNALNAAFEADRREAVGLSRSGDAYSQAAVLVRHLLHVGGREKIAQLLRAFTNNGLWDEIKINLLGEPSVEEALHEVYGLGQRELFEAAKPGA